MDDGFRSRSVEDASPGRPGRRRRRWNAHLTSGGMARYPAAPRATPRDAPPRPGRRRFKRAASTRRAMRDGAPPRRGRRRHRDAHLEGCVGRRARHGDVSRTASRAGHPADGPRGRLTPRRRPPNRPRRGRRKRSARRRDRHPRAPSSASPPPRASPRRVRRARARGARRSSRPRRPRRGAGFARRTLAAVRSRRETATTAVRLRDR